MQTVGTIADTFTGTVYHKPDRTRHSNRREQKKTDYGAQQRHNSFLKTTFIPIAPKEVIRNWGGEEYN